MVFIFFVCVCVYIETVKQPNECEFVLEKTDRAPATSGSYVNTYFMSATLLHPSSHYKRAERSNEDDDDIDNEENEESKGKKTVVKCIKINKT